MMRLLRKLILRYWVRIQLHIDGNGAVIDMNGSTYLQAFYVSASGVTIKNLTIINANYVGDGGAIYFSSSATSGTVSNCNFTDNTASSRGGAVYFDGTGTVTNCNFTDNSASSRGGAVYFLDQGTVTNCNFTNNSASSRGGAVYFSSTGNVSNCNFTGNTATGDSSYGGAIYIYSGTVTNCNFTDNSAYCGGAVYFNREGNVTNCNFINNNATGTNSRGGAVFFNREGTVSNCNFTDNTATYEGGAVYFNSNGEVTKCNFVDNKATGDSSYGGAIFIYSGTVTNCNFTGNTASRGGAVYLSSTGNVTYCNFINNKATGTDSWGGAIMMNSGSVENCNFINNKATGTDSLGGAVFFNREGTVTNCNFTGNTATDEGGAVYFNSNGEVTNCNFTDNTATGNGGAIRFNVDSTVTNCNFTNNTAYRGGAVYFYDNGNVTNCNFINNQATGDYCFGGAIFFNYDGTVTNCNFAGNNATRGSAIYFEHWDSSYTPSISNSILLNNRANAEALDVVKNDNNITITFTGKNNLLNTIYSMNDGGVTFTNVTYWGANGIANTGSSPTTPSRSNKATGQNITVGVVVNDVIVLNEVKVTDENGTIVLDVKVDGDYLIRVCHDLDSYYTQAETILSNMTFNVNVTSQTTTNKTVNITAKSNIYSRVMPGKLLFILPNGTQIEATYGANGIWWAEHTFDAYGEYKVNATYVGLDNVTINNGTITINKVNSTITLDNIVLDYGETKNVTVTTTGATGITAKIDGNNMTVINNYTIQIPVLDAGTYTLTVTTIPDDDHNPVTKEVNITVNKVEPSLTIDDAFTDALTSAEIIVHINKTATGSITIIVDGKPYTQPIKDGVATFTIDVLSAGDYDISAFYNPGGDKNYTGGFDTNSKGLHVTKVADYNIVLDVENITYGDGETVTVYINETGTVTLKLNGETYDAKDISGGKVVFPIEGLSAGNYTVEAIYIDPSGNVTSAKATFTVNKVNSTLTVNDIVFDYGSSGSTVVSLTGADGVNATVVGQPKAVVKVNGTNITVSDLDAGIYTLTVTTIADKNHNNITKNATITVNKVNATLTVNDVVLDYGESKNITVTTEGATGITAKIDGVDVTNNS